ncbi:pentatricopeptide repeat-containing protein At4g02750 [Selaginella moellendorffii]|uniref:pentatricopeptide repeat-containing protein At4g02750 n=1 Tax=Selaginella moellendorffii TaxID=88036 RepID=UPI000D1C4604|nr:pentatricopeptide repeat-containing protein At4g02750 [Selaginella moellendorffii]|eukprot:XP_024538834.1 pentatricopeptide repeat-containing protein At4g02750 [Selaginella moellendorffii]
MKKLPGNLLIEAASRRGSVADAQRAFDTIPAPNLYSWNLLLAAYAQNGHLWQARRVLACMPAPNVVSWNVLLSACSRRGRPDEARQLFHWMPQHDTVSWNTVEHMFAASGHCRDARQTFDAMPQRSVLSWNTLVSAYAFQRQLRDARLVLDLMPARNSISVNTMIKGYASAGALHAAALLFSAMPNRDLVSWNSMLTAASCWQQHQRLWHRMPRWDVVSCNARIQACLGSSLHADEGAATFWAMPGRDVVSWNTAAAGYARLGRPRHARRLLELMPQRDLVSANCWLHYCCHTPGATKLGFDAMPQRDSASWNSMLASCELPVADELFWRRMPAWDVISCTLMVAAYGRSLGGMDAAGRAFAAMQHRDVAAWTAIISAYATHGDCARGVAGARRCMLGRRRCHRCGRAALLVLRRHAGPC